MDMKRVSGRVDFTGWGFGKGDLDKIIAKAASETLRYQLREDPPWMCVNDSFDLTLLLSSFGDELDPPSYTISLQALIIEKCEEWENSDGKFCKDDSDIANIFKRLREIVDKAEKSVKRRSTLPALIAEAA